jgi:hypothetical protein
MPASQKHWRNRNQADADFNDLKLQRAVTIMALPISSLEMSCLESMRMPANFLTEKENREPT